MNNPETTVDLTLLFQSPILLINGYAGMFIISVGFILFFVITLVLYNIAYILGNKYAIKNNKISEKEGNIFLYTYIFKFFPLGGIIGVFLCGRLGKVKNIGKHIILGYVVYILLFILTVYLIAMFFEGNHFLLDSDYETRVGSLYPFFTFIFLLIIGIFGTIGFYLGKGGKNEVKKGK